jgi:hypothetical protein
MPPGTSNSAVLAVLSEVQASNQRMEAKIDRMDCRIQELERSDVANDNVAKTVDDHEKRLRELEKLAPAMRLVIWIAGVFGVSIIALIWALITGQAIVQFAK